MAEITLTQVEADTLISMDKPNVSTTLIGNFLDRGPDWQFPSHPWMDAKALCLTLPGRS
jgi:hypothetical protein